ncbi:poly ADP-ribose glycohydrolase PARG [Catovirus CTV1]|uniref:Poly ADP-ribose glycohydrolase PARG n=1 Tax=Catovirus CTV1 TaxID=1977631 RepID=A0A1V0S962_9VIRU|nr:poly ADP-ribose glycohydrolase PARG [Catovirus CTV1]
MSDDNIIWNLNEFNTFENKFPTINIKIEDSIINNKVVFSNKIIGAGPYGTQEELIFGSHPEAIVFSLVTDQLKENEAIVTFNVVRFADYVGYGSNVTFSKYCNNQICNLICMDALDFGENPSMCETNILREINKCYAGFRAFQGSDIATGKWGCGVFGGTVELKKKIQSFVAHKLNIKLEFCEP